MNFNHHDLIRLAAIFLAAGGSAGFMTGLADCLWLQISSAISCSILCFLAGYVPPATP